MTAKYLDRIIIFEPPLPCGTIDGDHICGKDATVAVVDYTAGHWYFLPICRDCTAAAAKTYGIADIHEAMTAAKGATQHARTKARSGQRADDGATEGADKAAHAPMESTPADQRQDASA